MPVIPVLPHLAAFAVGSGLALWRAPFQRRLSSWSRQRRTASLFGAAAGVVALQSAPLLPTIRELLAVSVEPLCLGWLVAVAASSVAQGELGWLEARVPTFIGRASYTIYLFQQPLFFPTVLLPSAAAMPVAVVVGACAYVWFEDPLNRRLRRMWLHRAARPVAIVQEGPWAGRPERRARPRVATLRERQHGV